MTGTKSPEELGIDTLLPIQCGGVFNSVIESYKRDIRSHQEMQPIVVAPYRETQRYLILDGHHRVIAAHNLGCISVGAIVHGSDEELRQTRVISAIGCDSLEELWERYEQFWLPRLVARGIQRATDLPVLSGAISQRY